MSALQIRGWLPFAAAAIAFAAGLVIAGMALLGGSAPDRADAAVTRPALDPVGSCSGLRSYLAKHRRALRVSGAGSLPGGVAADGIAAPSAAAEAAPPSGSTTNVQEAGVDEPDIVKSAASTIFTVDGTTGCGRSTPGPALRAGGLAAASAGRARRPRSVTTNCSSPATGCSRSAAATATGSAYEGDVGVSSERRLPQPPANRARRGRHLGSQRAADGPHDDVRGLVRQRPADRLDGSPGQLELSLGGVRRGRGHGRRLLPGVTLRNRASGRAPARHKLGGCGDVSVPSRFAGGRHALRADDRSRRGLPPMDVDSVFTGGEIVYASPDLALRRDRALDVGADGSGSTVSTQIHRFDITTPTRPTTSRAAG